MISALQPEFVDSIPKDPGEGILYISRKYSTAVHRCCCGCGQKVVTPLRPTDWKLTVRGDYVSLWPSIGNWSFPCRSHYWIVNNQIEWSYDMSQEMIEKGRRRDARMTDRYIKTGEVDPHWGRPVTKEPSDPPAGGKGWWWQLKKWLFG